MTPLHMQIMLHYYACYSPYAEHDTQHRYSSATRDYTQQLVKMGMLEPREGEPNIYKATERGRVYVERVTAIKPPRAAKCYIFNDGSVGTVDLELGEILAKSNEFDEIA